MDHYDVLQRAVSGNKLAENIAATIKNFFDCYDQAIKENGYNIKDLQPILIDFVNAIIRQIEHPYQYEPFHKAVTTPFDYYTFGIELFRPIVDFNKSTVQGKDQLNKIQKAIDNGDNVILLANHQTEPDPQAISLMLEKTHPQLAKDMIFVAGHRVTTDPLAVPFSVGRNLLCIYSKRHIDTEPDLKQEKMTHNQRTIKMMGNLLKEGGKIIYVAPSGGRDRRDATGNIAIAPFDPQSLEMFWLITQHAGTHTHFHTLTLSTFNMLPPPSSIEKELGEQRQTHSTPIHIAFGPEIDMAHFPGHDNPDKAQRRQNRADYLWQLVADQYKLLNQI